MLVTTLAGLMIMVLSMAMITINTIISKKTFSDREKSSPFECGFDPKSNARLPFSMHFFLIAVIFLIFDVEITLLMPMIYTMKITNLASFTLMFSYFIIILVLGVYHEWNQGALTWTK
uniref:NADH-ubiquinone oxidoreductase chain 3 n=1 Tax=Apatides fortis TaxID=590156 RepID=D1G5P1_APAFO|nr:NADH dehydrogenase subunit 3 [Apatides fortis]ACM45056.1 NADH dehydrogenase subunit 3 [Apatides fortis]